MVLVNETHETLTLTHKHTHTHCDLLPLSVRVAASSIVLGSGRLGLDGGAPEVCEDLWFTEGGHAGGEGDFGANGGRGVALLSLALRLLKLLCERIAQRDFNR